MKKLLIAMLITCSLGVVSCGRTTTETPSTNNNSGTNVTDGTDGNMNGTGVTDGTNSNTVGSSLEEHRTSVNGLYTDFKGKVEGGVENIKAEDWDTYSTEFKEKLTNLRNTVEDASLRSTLDDMENLFNEYDTAVREKSELAKDKVEEIKTKIENAFK